MKAGIIALVILLAVIGIGLWQNFRISPTSAIIETRNEHLIWDSPGCKVYQVVIKNEWGTHVLFITAADPSKTGSKVAVYPTCRVTL